MNTFSPEYKAIQEQFHRERPDYGTSGHKYADQILQLAQSLKTKDILDYGCGKCTLAKSLPFPIRNYDPFVPEHSSPPFPADIVVCTDVMEHVEEKYISSVFLDIQNLTRKMVFFEIATCPASKTLPDGRNAHITQHKPSWWLVDAYLLSYFEPYSFQEFNGFFLFIGGKKHENP